MTEVWVSKQKLYLKTELQDDEGNYIYEWDHKSEKGVALTKDCRQPCKRLDILEVNPGNSIFFDLTMRFGGGDNPIFRIYDNITINITFCNKDSANYSTTLNDEMFFEFAQYDTETNWFRLPGFFCTNPACCLNETEGLSSNRWYPPDNITWLDFNPAKGRFTVNTLLHRFFYVHYFKMNIFGAFTVTPLITVRVFPVFYSDPYYEEQLKLRVDGFNATFLI